MKKVIIYCPYPTGEAPSQRFRFEQYISYLKDQNVEIEIYPFLSANNWREIYQSGAVLLKVKIMLFAWINRWKSLSKVKKADFIFIHREMAQFGPPLFEWILAKWYKKPFIYDFDDAIWQPNFSESNRNFHWVKCYWKVKHIIKWADKVVVGNAYLKDFALQFNDNVIVIPTTIDLENHHIIQSDVLSEPLIIGWTGSHSTMHYLKDIEPVLTELSREFTFEFHVISNFPPDFTIENMIFVPWSKETEIRDLARFSIGIMPLADDQWAKGKCGFKALQYMALGIPSVISSVGVNTEIINDGENGFLFSTNIELKQKLEDLLRDRDLRKKIGDKGKLTIQEKYSVSANQNKYLHIFQ